MRPINPRKSKTFSFLIGLVYGYRTADMELKVLPLESFTPSEHSDCDVYYLDKKRDHVSKNVPLDNPTHIVVLKEDLEAKKVKLYIYKS